MRVCVCSYLSMLWLCINFSYLVIMLHVCNNIIENRFPEQMSIQAINLNELDELT